MTPQPNGSRGRRGTLGVAATAAVLLVVGLVAVVLGVRGHDGPPSPTTPTVAPSSTPLAQGRPATPQVGRRPELGSFLPASRPTRLDVPSIGLTSSAFVPLSIQRDGTISVPGTADEVGLYDGGPTPGQLGPAVLAAHVDTPSGRKGIFWNLGAVEPGQQVSVSRADGRRLTFTVDRVQAFKKSQFPTDLVYHGDFRRSEIRLVTCGGPVDGRNEYRDNVVVFGHLTGVA